MCLFGTISNTTINSGGHSVNFYHNSLSPWGGCCGFGNFMPGCFGYGFGDFNSGCFGYGFGENSFKFGAGAGLGMVAGMTLISALPSICKGIGKGCSWLWHQIFPKKETAKA